MRNRMLLANLLLVLLIGALLAMHVTVARDDDPWRDTCETYGTCQL